MRNLCYLHCTAGCERDMDRELLAGAALCGGGGILQGGIGQLWGSIAIGVALLYHNVRVGRNN